MLMIYGSAYFLFLSNVQLSMPGASDVHVFGQPGGGGLIILSLLVLERKPSRFWLPMLSAAILTLAVQVRAEWLSMLVAFSIWGVLEQKMTKVLSICGWVVVLLLAGFLADVICPARRNEAAVSLHANRGSRFSSNRSRNSGRVYGLEKCRILRGNDLMADTLVECDLEFCKRVFS